MTLCSSPSHEQSWTGGPCSGPLATRLHRGGKTFVIDCNDLSVFWFTWLTDLQRWNDWVWSLGIHALSRLCIKRCRYTQCVDLLTKSHWFINLNGLWNKNTPLAAKHEIMKLFDGCDSREWSYLNLPKLKAISNQTGEENRITFFHN